MNAFSITRRNPSFFFVWVGQILSQSGARVYQMAIIWWILSHTKQDSGTWIGTFMVMTALPGIFLVKQIGRWIDRSSSKGILVRSDLCSSILIAGVAILLFYSKLTLGVALIVGLVGAVLQSFIDPTLNKALAEVVTEEDFQTGLSLLATTQSLANFTGAVLGAFLIDRLGFHGTAAFAAVGYLMSAFATQLATFQEFKKEESGEVSAGWEILERYPILKRLLIGFGVINFFATPTLVVLPLYVKNVLQKGPFALGILEASLWMGLLLGSLLSPLFLPKGNRVKTGVYCLTVFGLGLTVPGVFLNEWIYLAALFIAGIALGINNVKFMGLFQDTVAPEIKGRFFALMQGIISFSFPIAYFLFGNLADRIPVTHVCIIQGLGVMALALYFIPLAKRGAA